MNNSGQEKGRSPWLVSHMAWPKTRIKLQGSPADGLKKGKLLHKSSMLKTETTTKCTYKSPLKLQNSENKQRHGSQ